MGRPSVLALHRFLRNRRESRDRLRAIHVGHAREGIALIDGNREGAVPVVLEVLRGDRIQDGIGGPGATEHVGHEGETDPRPDFARQGHADEASRLLAEGPDPGGRDELARNRQIRLGLAAISVVHEDELPATQRGEGALGVHSPQTPGGIYQDYCKNHFVGSKIVETESLFRRRGWRSGCSRRARWRPWIPEGCATSSPRFRSNYRSD